MKYTFTICEQGKEKEQKEGMSFKKMLDSCFEKDHLLI